jgi:hypothetical protein
MKKIFPFLVGVASLVAAIASVWSLVIQYQEARANDSVLTFFHSWKAVREKGQPDFQDHYVLEVTNYGRQDAVITDAEIIFSPQPEEQINDHITLCAFERIRIRRGETQSFPSRALTKAEFERVCKSGVLRVVDAGGNIHQERVKDPFNAP